MAGGRPPIYTKEESAVRQKASHRASKLRMQKAVAEAKLSKGCATCGYNTHPDALQFDHIVPVKVITRGRPRRDKDHKILRCESLSALAELTGDANIQVLCGNCHNIKSIAERRKLHE